MTTRDKAWPNALVVGAAKAGTNTLYSVLKQHPDIYLPEARVSLGYFCPDRDYPLRIRDEEEYLSFFAGAKQEKVRAEVSSLYLSSDIAAERIALKNPDSKIIISLRNPVEATYAAHNQRVYDGWETETDFEAALERDDRIAAGQDAAAGGGIATGKFTYKYIFGNYDLQVQRYWDAFGRDNVLIFIFEDLVADPMAAARRIYRFLGVDDAFAPEFGVHNPSKFVKNPVLLRGLQKIPAPLENMIRRALPPGLLNRLITFLKKITTTYKPRPPLAAETRAKLCREYAPMVERLGKMLGRDLSGWVKPPEPGKS